MMSRGNVLPSPSFGYAVLRRWRQCIPPNISVNFYRNMRCHIPEVVTCVVHIVGGIISLCICALITVFQLPAKKA